MTLSVDRVLPSMTPDSWDLIEIFAFAIAYGLYLTASTCVFFLFSFTSSMLTTALPVSLSSASSSRPPSSKTSSASPLPLHLSTTTILNST
ncbi:hypothetical protein H0H93_005356 [Arthromyces matolae]|nr:hypothetical protein H0H93_005356 [Arthromyces matolae]